MNADNPFEIMLAPVPLWSVAAVCVLFVVLHFKMSRRLNRQADSIANIDDWADIVDAELVSLRRSSSRKQFVPRRYGSVQSELWH
jgi:hypothetical protein